MSDETTTADVATNPADLFRLDDRVFILTGASSGLGHRFAKVLFSAGASLVITARRAERLDQLAAELDSGSGRVITVPADITGGDTADKLMAAALDGFGRVDGVVNNAGISRVLAAVDDNRGDFEQELAINLIAPYELARAAGAWMLDNRRPGSIINIGSILGGGGGGRLKVPGYAAAKGGLHNLTRELASQWARRSIRVNAIAPGWFETEMNSDMFGTDGGMAYIIDNTPMGRPGSDGELDGALLFLASDASAYVTGHVLYVDGGWSAI